MIEHANSPPPPPPAPDADEPFDFEAQTLTGQSIAGTLTAHSGEEARRQLEAMDLLVVNLERARPARPRPMRGEDFVAFNQQLAFLVKAGMPVEQGLRLIAHDIRSPGLARTIREVAEELEAGQPLGEVFERRRGQFPPLYGKLIDAGVAAGRLPDMLMNLGRQHDLIQRLRTTLWRTLAYPIIILIITAALMVVLGLFIVPQFEDIYEDFDTELPAMTKAVLAAAAWTPVMVAVLGILILGLVLAGLAMTRAGRGQWLAETFFMPLPMIGPVLKAGLLARWCNAVYLGVDAGLPLPQAIGLASDAVHSPSLRTDSRELVDRLSAGQPMTDVRRRQLLPMTVLKTMEMGMQRHDLPATLLSLSQMYQQQALTRMGNFSALALPLMVMLIGFLIFFITLALFLPMIKLITSLT